MARGLNKVILIGNLGADPETRAMPSGMTVANLRIATSESWRDKQSGEQQERTEWHNVALFGRLGEVAAEYLRKGSQVYIEGRLRTRKWQDKQGNDRYTTEIVGNEMLMLGGKSASAGASIGGAVPEMRDRPDMAETAERGEPASRGGNDFDDDIPFLVSRRASMPPMPGRFFIKTFGCQMNEYDSARIADVLSESCGLVPTAGPSASRSSADEYLLGAREGAGEGLLAARAMARAQAAPPRGDDRRRRLRGKPGGARDQRARALCRSGVWPADPAPPAADDR